MTAAKGEGTQPYLFPVGGLGPPSDPVGDALELEDGEDPAQAWEEVMGMFARMAVRAYFQAQDRPQSGS